MIDFEQAINDLDLGLFEKVPSQTTIEDKTSFLAIELAVRDLLPEYNYLEIGSYLGGSIQPHLIDSHCRHIYSLDKRPLVQADARGYDWVYQNNSTQRMLDLLKEVGPVDKVTTIDGDSREVDPSKVSDKIQLCLIDGEHTDDSVYADFLFCLKTLDTNGAIVFHDAQITYNGIMNCTKYLEERGVGFKSYVLPHIAFVIEIGDFPLHKHERIAELLMSGHKSYLYSLQYNDNYRRFSTRFPFGMVRRTLIRLRGGNVSQ